MTDFDAMRIPPDPQECEHTLCEFCNECHTDGCFLQQPLCDDARKERKKLVIEQATIYLSDSSGLCIVRDITLERPNSQWGTIPILGQPIEVCYSYDGEVFILADNHPEDIEVFFREGPTKEDRAKHPRHKEKNIYWGGCHFCDCEKEAKKMELRTRKITHVSFFYMDGTGYVRGLVENAQTQEDLVWAAKIQFNSVREPDDKLVVAKQAIAQNPLAKDAIWLEDNEFQQLINSLPPARRSQSFVDFGNPYIDEWARQDRP